MKYIQRALETSQESEKGGGRVGLELLYLNATQIKYLGLEKNEITFKMTYVAKNYYYDTNKSTFKSNFLNKNFLQNFKQSSGFKK